MEATQPAPQTLPREVLKWIQSLDLSYSVRNAKRDFANGFLVAEIFSRYFPQEISMHSFENATKMSSRNDNWEQLFRFFKKKHFPITRSDFEPVISTESSATVAFLVKCYTILTKRTVPIFLVQDLPLDSDSPKRADATMLEAAAPPPPPPPPVETSFDEHRSFDNGRDAFRLFEAARGAKPVERSAPKAVAEREDAVPLEIQEVKSRVLTKNVAQLRVAQQVAQVQKSRATTSMSGRRSTGGTDGPATPALGFLVGTTKPVLDIMRPVVSSALQENARVMKSLDPRKDVVISFMELCRTHVPEGMCVRVFDGLAEQAPQLADAMIRSPADFWRVWTLFCPTLVTFSETSPVFESITNLFKQVGSLMQGLDPVLTQQLMVDTGLPSLAPLLIEASGKREPLCELVYTYTQQAALSRLGMLRALKEALDRLPVYIGCLSYFITFETQASLLNEHLTQHYMYYALVALQCPQPSIRVAGLSVLVTVTAHSLEHCHSVLALLPSLTELVQDTWWEVQAQLILLAAQLLQALATTAQGRAEATQEDAEAAAAAVVDEEYVEALLGIVNRIMGVPGTSSFVLQVGICALASRLRFYPSLLPAYVNALLRQPAGYRQRLLQASRKGDDGTAPPPRRLAYVMGTSSRLYEEFSIADYWPSLDVARTLAEHCEAAQLPNFDPEHLEVLTACLPETELELDSEWLSTFEKVKSFVFVALVDPLLHRGAADVIRRFWLCRPQHLALRAIDSSKQTLLQTLRMNFSAAAEAQTRVDDGELMEFLREMRDAGGAVKSSLQSVVDQFREAHNVEFQKSGLETLFE